MLDGYSLKSIVDQMKSDGRSFEEIQSVVREYKRRKDSKPVVDLVGVTMEDKPLEEFVAPEKQPLRYINYPVENKKTGAGVWIKGDKLVQKLSFWSISTTICPEPYIDVNVDPGGEFSWNIIYNFYTCNTLH